MSTAQRTDESTEQIEQLLANAFPRGQVKAYRYGNYDHVIRVRVVDERFGDLPTNERYDLVEHALTGLPEELRVDITMLVLLTPDELHDSSVNREFESPSPSLL